MSSDKIYQSIKESRGWYFVEYRPPVGTNKFATLDLVIIEKADKTAICNEMEKELRNWLSRYPIPLFVTAFDEEGDRYDFSEIKSCNHLMGYVSEDGKINIHWQLLRDDEIPNISLNQEYLDKVYTNLDFNTYAELDLDRKKRRRQLKIC